MASLNQQFEALYIEFFPSIYRFLRLQLGSADDAEEVTANVFAHAYEAFRDFDPSRPAAPWLFRIARNSATDHFRRRSVRDRFVARFRGNDLALDPGEVATTMLAAEEILIKVRELPSRQRDSICLRELEDLSFSDIGGVLDCSEDAAKMAYHRGIKELRLSIDAPQDG